MLNLTEAFIVSIDPQTRDAIDREIADNLNADGLFDAVTIHQMGCRAGQSLKQHFKHTRDAIDRQTASQPERMFLAAFDSIDWVTVGHDTLMSYFIRNGISLD